MSTPRYTLSEIICLEMSDFLGENVCTCQQMLEVLPVSWSVVTAAVRPTPDEPRPVVGIALGAVNKTYRSNWDFATEGSPENSQMKNWTVGPEITFKFNIYIHIN